MWVSFHPLHRGALRAKRAPGRSFLGLSIFFIYPEGSRSILDCARRTSTFLSCAFREQEDDQAGRSYPPKTSFVDCEGCYQTAGCREDRTDRIDGVLI
jgi:hypothetical protein